MMHPLAIAVPENVYRRPGIVSATGGTRSPTSFRPAVWRRFFGRFDPAYDTFMDYGPGRTGNIVAAVCSFFIPGLGQLVEGRLMWALIHVTLGVLIWIVSFGTLGWVVHLWSTIDAAIYRPELEVR